MLTIFRRHMKGCKHIAKGRAHRHCNCPISIEGRLHGEMIRRSLDIRNWEAAQKTVREWEAGKKNPTPTIEEVSKRLIADMKSRALAQQTIDKFELLTEELSEQFPGLEIDQFTPDNLAKFREGWKLASSTSRKKLVCLRSLFKFAVERKWIDRNPASPLRPPKETNIERKPYTAQELEKIEWAIPLYPIKGIYGEESRDRIKAFIATLRRTGLRIGDVVGLPRRKVQGGMVTLRTQKNGNPVCLPVHPEVEDGLEKMTEGEFYFWSGEGKLKSAVGDWQRTLRRLGEIAGVHIHAHRWRHTFATELLSKGVPVSEVAAILGISPRIVEKHYSQWIQSRQDSLNAAVKATWA